MFDIKIDTNTKIIVQINRLIVMSIKISDNFNKFSDLFVV